MNDIFNIYTELCVNVDFIDFGIVLGSRIFIKEGTKGGDNSVQEGDILLKINNHSVTDGMTLKEARRLIESAKDKLSLTVRREGSANGSLQYSGSSEPTSLHTKGKISSCVTYILYLLLIMYFSCLLLRK